MELKTFLEQTLDECKRRLYRTLQGLTPAELAWRPGAEANSICFMVWHVARVEDRWLHRFAGGLATRRVVSALWIARARHRGGLHCSTGGQFPPS